MCGVSRAGDAPKRVLSSPTPALRHATPPKTQAHCIKNQVMQPAVYCGTLTRSFELRAIEPISAGQEALITYGDAKPNSQLLRDYGAPRRPRAELLRVGRPPTAALCWALYCPPIRSAHGAPGRQRAKVPCCSSQRLTSVHRHCLQASFYTATRTTALHSAAMSPSSRGSSSSSSSSRSSSSSSRPRGG